MVFNILIDNTDDHEKNQFGVGTNQRDSTLANAMSQCELFGYPPAQAAAEVVRVIKVVDGWRKHFAACGVTAADIRSLAERIDGDPLRLERRKFDPADHAGPARPPRRRSPFAG